MLIAQNAAPAPRSTEPRRGRAGPAPAGQDGWPVPEPSLEPIQYLVKDETLRAELLAAETRRRCRILDAAEDYPDYRDFLRAQCKIDVPFFFDNFVDSYDPRDLEFYPMVLWPVQRAYLAFIEENLAAQRDWLCEKSRDMGATYLNCGFGLHHWLFVPKFKSSFVANKSSLVDELGNQDTIFQKMRMVLEALPWWLKPRGFDPGRHVLVNRFVNPENGNTMIGLGGENAGRGGRASIVFLDEAAHIDNAEAVNAATSRTSRCRGWVSSANYTDNFFYERKVSGQIPVFTMHWRDHPLKDDAWAKAEKARVTAATFAMEDDIAYEGAREGGLIEKSWVDAAVELWKRLPHPEVGPWVAGLDIGAGGADLSVYQPRRGPVVPKGTSRQDGDTINTANWALDLSRQRGVATLIYDTIGVGEGVKAALKRGWHHEPAVRIIACNWGLGPTSSRRWEDGRSSRDRFANIKAELCWTLRERFRTSHEHFLWLTGEPEGVEHDLLDCILLEPSADLQRELLVMTWTTTTSGSKIIMESKTKLQKSPDWFDALAYSFFLPPQIDFATQVIIGGEREAAGML
jgi:phage terminase large subunit